MNQVKLQPIQHHQVVFTDQFWKPRIKINREQTIPFQYEQCEKTGRLEAFKLKWKEGDENKPHPFWDSDIAKWLEAASYSYATHPDEELDQLMDEVIQIVASAQQEDGYLNIYFSVVKPKERWTDLRDAHELYCAGHLIEAGVAHYQATGKDSLLQVVMKYADYIAETFGKEQGKIPGYPGHEEIELALVKLYRVTKDEKYLHLSQFFVNERGQEPHYFDIEEKKRGTTGYFGNIAHYFGDRKEYNQSHKPVREQEEVKGHSVRAMYLFSAMADLSYELEDQSLWEACMRLWNNMVYRKMYITGGIGSSGGNEGFSKEYHLPNRSYAETCAAIGVVFWNHRLLQYDCNRKFADVLERALYNGVMSGVSLDGKKFFYVNPLESDGEIHRNEWFGVACCPPNIARLLSSLGQYMYSYDGESIYTHLYIDSEASFEINNNKVIIKQETNYPWNSQVQIQVNVETAMDFGLNLRIPGWCENFNIKINNEEVKYQKSDMNKGYLNIRRNWNNQDTVLVDFDMPVQKIYSHPNVAENVNRVALQRGPIVYCLEEVDQDCSTKKIVLPRENQLAAKFEKDLLDGVVTITGEALYFSDEKWEQVLYASDAPELKRTKIKAVPYYAWDNREAGDMTVWIHEK